MCAGNCVRGSHLLFAIVLVPASPSFFIAKQFFPAMATCDRAKRILVADKSQFRDLAATQRHVAQIDRSVLQYSTCHRLRWVHGDANSRIIAASGQRQTRDTRHRQLLILYDYSQAVVRGLSPTITSKTLVENGREDLLLDHLFNHAAHLLGLKLALTKKQTV